MTTRSVDIPPPVGGWNTTDPLTAMNVTFAPTLDNFLIDRGRPRVRPGYRVWATGLGGRVDALLEYRSGTLRKLYGAAGGSIFDVTAGGAVGAAVVTGMTTAFWEGVMVAAAGDDFLLACNGTDVPRTFNGTTWAAWAATGLAAQPAAAMVFKGRVFAYRPDRLEFYYGGAGAIAGAYTLFPLQGVARRGGGVAAMASLTQDSGAGLDDLLLILTTQGEMLAYSGTDPSSATTWRLVGSFPVPGRPLATGQRTMQEFGGDVLVLTEAGVFPATALASGANQTQLMGRAATRLIQQTFVDLARGRGTENGWALVSLPALAQWIVNVPWGAADAQQIAFSGVTGAASRWNRLAAASWIESAGRAYFGTAGAGGQVLLFGEDNTDVGMAIAAEAVGAFSTFGSANAKQFVLSEVILSDGAGVSVRVDLVTDWQVPVPDATASGAGAPSPPPPLGLGTALYWGTGLWNVNTWAGENVVTRGWRVTPAVGRAAALRLRLVVGDGTRPAWLGSAVQMRQGATVR